LLARSSLPTVLTYHSDIVRQEKLLLLYRPLLQRILERVDLILVSSPNMVEHSEFLRPVAAKCRVVPFGVDVDRLAGSAVVHAKAKQLRAAHHRPVVLFVGRLVYYKGVDVLVRAIAEVDADLVLVGRGPLEHQLRVLAAQLGATERLTFLPYLESDDLTAWYHAADLLCLPSVARAEAFGLVQLEAQAAGTPVVSTRLATGVPFVNRNNVTGLTVTPGDPEALAAAMRRLLEDEQLRLRLGRQARDRVRRQFTSELMVKRTVDVYQEALMKVMRGGLG
jgi:rhamnosyl/mannosyltransferase